MQKAHELDIVEIINATDIDFVAPENQARLKEGIGEAIRYGKHPYHIKSGEKKTYQRFLADHCIKHMTNAVMSQKRANGESIAGGEEEFKKEWREKLFVGVKNQFQPGDTGDEGARVASQQEQLAQQQQERMEKMEQALEDIKNSKKKKKK